MSSTEASCSVPGLVPRELSLDGPPRQSRAASSVIVVPVSALLTGQPSLAACAAFSKPAASRPSTSPRTVSLMPVMRKPPAAVRAERDVGRHVERLRRAAGLGDVGRELHRVARRVRGGDQLLGARGAACVVRSALREADVERADLAAAELDLAGTFLERAVPGGAGGTGGHVMTSMSGSCRCGVPGASLAPSPDPCYPAAQVDEHRTTATRPTPSVLSGWPRRIPGV